MRWLVGVVLAGCGGGGGDGTGAAETTAVDGTSGGATAPTSGSNSGTSAPTSEAGASEATSEVGTTSAVETTHAASTGEATTADESSGGATSGGCAAGQEPCPSGCCAAVEVGRLIAGEFHSCVVTGDGGVACWGRGGIIGQDADSNVAVAVPGLADVTAIAGKDDHSCALLESGGVMCWGGNFYGSLGDGMPGIDTVTEPVVAIGLEDAVAIWAGAGTSCARRAGGEIWCWGRNDEGQLGTGNEEDSAVPIAATALAGVDTVAPAGVHACGLAGGGVLCWGDNSFGQLGNGKTTDSVPPVMVMGLEQAGAFIVETNGAHSCVVAGDGAPLCWGNNDGGQFGTGETSNIEVLPQATQGLAEPVVALSAGFMHTCAVVASGAVWCWGEGGVGQLGDGATMDRYLPVAVAGLPGPASAVACGAGHTCARVGEAVHCWGDNTWGQLGDGSNDPSPTPVVVSGV